MREAGDSNARATLNFFVKRVIAVVGMDSALDVVVAPAAEDLRVGEFCRRRRRVLRAARASLSHARGGTLVSSHGTLDIARASRAMRGAVGFTDRAKCQRLRRRGARFRARCISGS